MKIVSACLAGCRCRYDAKLTGDARVIALVASGEALPVCPEQMGGASTPRSPNEIRGGDGGDVLDGRARVVDSAGNDQTALFVAGAREVLRLAQLVGATEAILKERSPSCGSNVIYDGTFSGVRQSGMGVTAALLAHSGLRVYSEETFPFGGGKA